MFLLQPVGAVALVVRLARTAQRTLVVQLILNCRERGVTAPSSSWALPSASVQRVCGYTVDRKGDRRT